MKNDVIEYIQACIACATIEPANCKFGLYLPLPIPDKPWHLVSMGFMCVLPTTKHRHDCVYVVVDRFLKMAILMACRKAISTEEIVKLFFEDLCVHSALPIRIFSNRMVSFSINFGLDYRK